MVRGLGVCLAALLVAALVPAAQGGLIFTAQDISTTGGSTTLAPAGPAGPNTVYTVVGDGADIWTAADHFQYYWAMTSADAVGNSDFLATVRLRSQGNTNTWAKAGIMARESTGDTAHYEFTAVTPGNGIVAQFHSPAGWVGSTLTTTNSSTPDLWVSLLRATDTFSYMWSLNNDNGTAGDPTDDYAAAWSAAYTRAHGDDMPGAVLLGLADTSHSTGNYSTDIFDHFEIKAPRGVLSVVSGSILGGAYPEELITDTLVSTLEGEATWSLYDLTVSQLLGTGTTNVGAPGANASFGIGALSAGIHDLQLTVGWAGMTYVYQGEFEGMPEPTTCLLLGGGLLALVRRRRQRKS